MSKTISLLKKSTLVIIPFCMLHLGVTALHADDTPATSTCVKRPFKEVKVVTPFSITHRPQTKKMLFDDIACGLKWREKQCSSGQGNFDAGALVYDFNTLAEIAVSEATFVQSTDVVSPMGSGLVAFASPADADKFIAQKGGGKKLTYQEVLLLKFE
jgi:hypothetical protein